MSTAGPEAVLRDLFGRLAAGDLDGSVALIADDAEWRTLPTLAWSQGEYRGPEGVRQYLISLTTSLVGASIVPERYLESGSEVVVLGTASGRASTTGRPVSTPFAFVFGVRDGLVRSLQGFVDTATIRDAFADGPSPAGG